MPIGTDLVMHEETEPEKVRNNGAALGRVIERAARRWGTPLAVPLMDLRLEKIDLLALAGISATEAESYHVTAPLEETALATMCGEQTVPLCPGSSARDEALTYIRTQQDLIPVGMAIGPFSLTTRLLADPITAAAMAGSGLTHANRTKSGCCGNACASRRLQYCVPCAARSGTAPGPS